MALIGTDRNAIEAFLKAATGVAGADCKKAAQLKLGTFYYDCANWDDATIGFADGTHVCDIYGVRVVRDAALANGKYSYKDIYGTEIDTNV